jgi:hypothetical protein
MLGTAGLSDDGRPGRPPVCDHGDLLLLVKLVTEPPPDHATQWSVEVLTGVIADHGLPPGAWAVPPGRHLHVVPAISRERTTGFEPATLTLAR